MTQIQTLIFLSRKFSDKPFCKHICLTLCISTDLSQCDGPWTVSMVTETCDWKQWLNLIENRKMLVYPLSVMSKDEFHLRCRLSHVA